MKSEKCEVEKRNAKATLGIDYFHVFFFRPHTLLSRIMCRDSAQVTRRFKEPCLLWIRSGISNENSDSNVLVDSENKVLKIVKLSESPVNTHTKKC